MTTPRLLAAAAGCALAFPVIAQTTSEVPPLPIGPRIAPLSDRVIVPVYNAIYDECGSTPFAIGAGSSYVMEDVSFHPGPWGNTYTGPRDIVQVDGMFQSAGWTSTPTMRITQLFEFYEPGNFTTAPMLGNTIPLAVRAVPTNFGPGYAWNYTSEPFTTPVSLGTRVNVWVAIKATDPLTGHRIADGASGLVQPVGETAVNYGVWLGRAGQPCIGSTDPRYARDRNPNGPTGAPADFGCANGLPGPGCDISSTGVPPDSARCLTLGLRGEVVVVPPTPNFTRCPINDGVTSNVVSIPNAGVAWGQICTNSPVTDSLLRFLNVDTEGSSSNFALALYDIWGTLLATDEDSGDEANAQLTFGLGRADAVGNGAQYDGRDGQLTVGTFYIAVAPAGSSFSDAFTVVPGTAGGVGLVNFNTNVNAGGGLPPSVPPIINHFDLTLTGPAWTPTNTDTFRGTTGDGNPNPNDDDSAAVLWSKFAIAPPGADTFHYLDIDFGVSDYADNAAYLFDSAGSLIAYSDDQIPSTHFLPAFSFGASIPGRNTANGQPRAVTNHADFVFAGQHGLLAPGTYYLAMVAWPADVLTGSGGGDPLLGPNRRWHVRGLSSMNIGHTADFYTGSSSACDPIDFNNDGLFPDTLDIADFLAVFGGGACSNDPHCGDIDYNNDGLFPDTLDIDALLSVFSGGPCLR